MAERRMFAKTIILSDEFLDMPTSARCLYFTLGMLADDDGFINNPKSIMRQCGASMDDLNILLAKKFVLVFDDGVIVIKHWLIHNYIRPDRYKPTKYVEHKETLYLDENKAYTNNLESAKYTLENVGIPNGYQMDTQDRIGKDSIGKDKKENINKEKEEIVQTLDNVQSVLDKETTYSRILNYCKEDCIILYNRYMDKVNNNNLNGAREVIDMLGEITSAYSDEKLRELFKKANKTYWVKPKYHSIDFAYMLNHLKELEELDVAEQPNTVEKPQIKTREYDSDYFKSMVDDIDDIEF